MWGRVSSKSLYALIKSDGSDVHDRLFRPELRHIGNLLVTRIRHGVPYLVETLSYIPVGRGFFSR